MTFTAPLRGSFTFDADDDFGWYSYTLNGQPRTAFHAGVDYGAPNGTAIYSISNGRVVHASESAQHPDFGYFVVIQHKDSNGSLIDRFSFYAHLNSLPLVDTGDDVIQNVTQLGGVGSFGLSTGNHLHLSVLRGLTASQIEGIADGSIGFSELSKAVQAGTVGADVLYGDISRTVPYGSSSIDDYFMPMAGSDIIYGGGGTDTVEYQERIENIWFTRVNATSSIVLAVDAQGNIDGDILFDVERIADDGGRNIINLSTAPQQTLFVGSSSSSTRYIVPSQEYANIEIDGGAGEDVAVVWGVRADWNLTDVAGPGYWLTSNSTPPTSLRTASSLPSSYTVDLTNVELIEFEDGTFTINELMGGTSSGGRVTVGVRVVAGEDPFEEGDDAEQGGYSFEFFLNEAATENITVHWTVSGFGVNGTNGADFVDGTSGTVTIEAGDLLDRFSVDILGDNVPEFDETFRLQFRIDSSDTDIATVGQGTAYGTLINDDGFISGDDDYGDDFATASLVPSDPNELDGIIENPNDIDFFRMLMFEGVNYSILYNATSGSLEGPGGARYRLYDSSGNEISFIDTNPTDETAATEFLAPETGTYYLSVESPGRDATGDYQILIFPHSLPSISSPESHVTLTEAQTFTGTFVVNPSAFSQKILSFRSDQAVADMSRFNFEITELNGTPVFGEWVPAGGGVWNFVLSASITTYFLVRISAATPGDVVDFDVARLNVGESLPPLPAVFDGTSASETIDANNVANTIQGLAGNDSILADGGNDSVYGGGGRDTLSGGEGDDLLFGGNGTDELLGGDGDDTASYRDSKVGVQVSLQTGIGLSGTAAGDRLILVENLIGSRFADSLSGDNFANAIDAGSGDDTLFGLDGNDSLTLGDGNDSAQGGVGDDSLYGGKDNDLIDGGDGNDLIDGGAGIDLAVFSGAGPITVNLNVTTAQTTGQGQDTLLRVENVATGSGNDRVTGNQLGNAIQTQVGNDVLIGNAGDDTLDAGDGDDEINAGTGNDFVDGGLGVDTIIFTGSTAIRANLSLTTAQDTGQGIDTILNVEDVTAGTGNDTLTGSAANNTLIGNAGLDQLFGGGGRDSLSGGNDNDALNGGKGNDTLSGGAGTDAFIFTGRFGRDTVTDFVAGSGSGDILNLAGLGLTLADLSITSQLGGTATRITVVATGDSITLTTVAFGTLDIAGDLIL